MRRVALADIGTRGSFSASGRYGAAAAQPTVRDRVAEAFQEGLAEGRRQASDAAAHEQAQTAQATRAIELAFAKFDDASAQLLQERLRDTVVAICQAMAGEIAVDPKRLALRVETAAAMLRRAHDARIVRLNPADLALVEGRLTPALDLAPDPSLARGQLRVESEEGGVEDGAQQWHAALAEALGPCAH